MKMQQDAKMSPRTKHIGLPYNWFRENDVFANSAF